MKKVKTVILLISAFIVSSCSSEEICECFETRLEIKKMYKETTGLDETLKMTESEAYKELKAKKEKCKNEIEPEFFKNVETVYQNEQDLLKGELGDCPAVIELMGE